MISVYHFQFTTSTKHMTFEFEYMMNAGLAFLLTWMRRKKKRRIGAFIYAKSCDLVFHFNSFFYSIPNHVESKFCCGWNGRNSWTKNECIKKTVYIIFVQFILINLHDFVHLRLSKYFNKILTVNSIEPLPFRSAHF